MTIVFAIYMTKRIILIDHDLELNQHDYNKLNEFCDKSVSFVFMGLFYLTKKVRIQDVLICANILKLKSSKDIIQGISKLDYLLKVSIF